jgi:uncharacterized protein Yka (UPF0111/DUF47 family)
MTLKRQLEDLESRIKGLEKKLDAVLNILVSDLYEDEFQDPSVIEMEDVHDELTKFN